MVKVFKITTFNDDIYYITPKQYELIKNVIGKKTTDGLMLGESFIRLSTIKQIDSKNMEFSDLPKYCQERLKKDGGLLLDSPSEENLGVQIGVDIEVYDEKGNRINQPLKTDSNPPKRFAIIKRPRYMKEVGGENGGVEQTFALGKPIEETYYRSIKENGYYDFVLVLSVGAGRKIILDRRPKGWAFDSVPGLQ